MAINRDSERTPRFPTSPQPSIPAPEPVPVPTTSPPTPTVPNERLTEEISTTQTKVPYDPISSQWVKMGKTLAIMAAYLQWMIAPENSGVPESQRCSQGIALGKYEGTAQTDGALFYDGQRFDFRELEKVR